MDALSITASVAGVVSLSIQLLGGCIQGFVLLSTAQNIGKDASTIVCMLNIQEIQLTEWARRAGLLSGDGTLDHRLNAKAVEETLHRIQDMLLNMETLKKRYGLTLIPPNQQATATAKHAGALSDSQRVFTGISDEIRQQILDRAKLTQQRSLFKRLRWATVDKDKIEKLVGDVHFLVRELWHLLDPWRCDDLLDSTKAIAANMISLNNRFDQLQSLSDALNTLQNKLMADSGRTNLGVKSLAVSAEIKAFRAGLEDEATGPSPSSNVETPKRYDLLKSLERLSRFKMTKFKPMAKSQAMGSADYDGERVFIEWKSINPSLRSKILPRAENLALLLHLPKDETFQSLTCRGIVEQDSKIAFIFHHPSPQGVPGPSTLLDLFSAKDGIEVPSLSDRIQLAVSIARTVQNFHRSGWLHKSLRSDKILFFHKSMSPSTPLENPILTGFEFARFGSPTEISEQPSANPKHDIYRHPSAMGEPSESFSELMDLYSLGTILIEIAEWRALRYIVDSVVDVDAENVPLTQLAAIKPFLLSGKGKGGTSKLKVKMGNIYTLVCMMCLSGKVEHTELDSENDFDTQRSVLDIAVRRLESCKI